MGTSALEVEEEEEEEEDVGIDMDIGTDDIKDRACAGSSAVPNGRRETERHRRVRWGGADVDRILVLVRKVFSVNVHSSDDALQTACM